MDIVYEKNIVFEYNCDRMKELTFKKVAAELAKKGLYLVSSSGVVDKTKYGYINTESIKTTYNLMIPTLSDKPIIEWGYQLDAIISVDAFSEFYDDVSFEVVNEVTTKKEWAEVLGSTITMFDDNQLFNTPNIDQMHCNNEFVYGIYGITGDLTMEVRLVQTWQAGLELRFEIEWCVDEKQTPFMIAKVLDDLLLDDINMIKKIVDSVLKSKKFGVDVELSPAGSVDMVCWSNTKIDVKQECSLESRQKLGGSQ
jgi:hypothetical protein